MDKLKNRWLIAACAVGIHISIGSIYAYSVVTKPVAEIMGCESSDVKIAFSIAIFFLGISAAFLGHFVEKHGPRKAGMLAACFYGFGIIGTGVAVSLKSMPLFYLTYGVMGGIGLGVGYITPVSTLIKWFPDKRGLATGMAIMGFGFASMIFAPIMNAGFSVDSQVVTSGVETVSTVEGAKGANEIIVWSAASVSRTFMILGAVYLTVIFLSAQYLTAPPKGWFPKGFDPSKKTEKGKPKKTEDLSQLTANEAVKTRRFYYMWLMLFINITCGIAVISVASPMAQDIAGLTAKQASIMVGLMGLFNGLGRIGWASISDYIGRPATYTLFFLLQIAAFLLLPQFTNAILFQAVIFLILSCYGGGFSSVPAYLGDLFGTKQLGAIHGYTLTAWAAAGVIGPSLASFVKAQTQSYNMTLYIFAGLFVVALVVSSLMKLDIRSIRATKKITHTDCEARPA